MAGRKHLARLVSAACVGALLVIPVAFAQAQEKKPSDKFNSFSAKNLVVGKRFKVDRAFGEKYGIPVAAPFQLIVATDKSYNKSPVHPAPKPGSAYVKFNFTTLDRKLLKNLQFVAMTIPMVDPEQRLKATAQLVSQKAFPIALQGYQNSKRPGLRKVKIGPYVAVALIGSYTDKTLGNMYLRVVAIPNPKGEAGIVTIANIAAANITVKSAND